MAVVALAHCPDGRCRPKLVEARNPFPSRNSPEISAAVGVNAANHLADVRVIQDALNQVPAHSGGPEPPLKVDGLCYGKTQAAIKRFQKEACHFKWPDGRVDPNGKTHQRLKDFFVPANPYTVPYVYRMLPKSLLWIMAAKRVLGDADLHLRGRPGFGSRMELVNRYFHLDQVGPQGAAASLARIRGTFIKMETCIGHSSPFTELGSGYFQEDPLEAHASGYTFHGGFTRRSQTKTTPPMSREDRYSGQNLRQDTIFICPRVLNAHSDFSYTRIIVHELAHFCGPEPGGPTIDDYGYRDRKVPAELDKFFDLRPEKAIRTADCYAEFAGYAYLGREVPGR
jgi:hypothetical protein